MKKDFIDYEYTVGCRACDNLRLNRGQGANHNEACRRRIMEELSKTEAGRARIARDAYRLSRRRQARGDEEEERRENGPSAAEDQKRQEEDMQRDEH